MKKSDPLKRELALFALIAILSIIAALYLVYKAAFCFDPYYTYKTEGRWPYRIWPCVKINILEK